MKYGLYLSVARSNLLKNTRFYVPKVLAEAGLLASFYIVYTLRLDPRIQKVPGGDYVPSFMTVGAAVILLLSAILILYANSFLMKQRKREYGLYSVLGMETKHIGRVLFWEALLSDLLSLGAGILSGILFYKLCALLICIIFSASMELRSDFITAKSIVLSLLYFALLNGLSFCINRISLARLKPVQLLASKAEGEREPRVKNGLLIAGLLSLLTGYGVSIFTTDPVSALVLFFAAVFLVIIGTYCLFTSGSIFVLKRLKQNEAFYYNRKHFTAVSGLLYRMKQNAVGLASVCILATGVLVMVSTTVSLYSGMDSILDSDYPDDVYLSGFYETAESAWEPFPADVLEALAAEASEACGLSVASVHRQQLEPDRIHGTENGEGIALRYTDREQACQTGSRLNAAIFDSVQGYVESIREGRGSYSVTLDTYWNAKEELIGMYGSLLFLGVILGSVCIFATALVLYYKQISEGYEDRSRYQIMKKVGMCDREIRGSIRSQTLWVFFLPLAAAGLHMAFASPILIRMLRLLLLPRTEIYILCACITFGAFAVLYAVIYGLTARTYYKIVR